MSVSDISKRCSKPNTICQQWQLTDHANMMGAFHFVNAVCGHKHNSGVKAQDAESAEETGGVVTR